MSEAAQIDGYATMLRLTIGSRYNDRVLEQLKIVNPRIWAAVVKKLKEKK